MTTLLHETSNKTFSIPHPPTLPSRNTCFMQRILYEHPTCLCRGLPYYTDAVTMETWRVWIWQSGCPTQRFVMLAERTAILECAEYFINVFLYSFRFPVLLGCISPHRKQMGPAVHSVLCTYKILVCWALFSANVCTILPNVLCVPTWAQGHAAIQVTLQ